HEERHTAEVLVAPVPRGVAEHLRLAGCRIQQTGEHLQGRGLPRPVRTEEADDLAGLDHEVDAADRFDLFEGALEQGAHGRTETGLALVHLVDLAQPADVYDAFVHRDGERIAMTTLSDIQFATVRARPSAPAPREMAGADQDGVSWSVRWRQREGQVARTADTGGQNEVRAG